MNSNKNVSRGRGRGVLGLSSYEPCPRPSRNIITHTTLNDQPLKNIADPKKPVNIVKPLELENEKNNAVVTTRKINSQGTRVLAKYNYKAKLDRPGGFDELTLVQGEILALLRKGHDETNNHLWWEVRNDKGDVGFAPHNYLQILEQTPTNLPWLENKRLLEEKERKQKEKELGSSDTPGFGINPQTGPPKVKQYLSAYSEKKASNAAEAAKLYFCEICDKNLNGPQPYKMHMSSKAHREEVEYLKSR